MSNRSPARRPGPGMSGWRRVVAVAGLTALLSVGSVDPIDAQTIRGRVVDEGTDTAIAGALVLLISPDGEEAASTVSGGTGAYSLRVPSPGEWSLRVERIGFASSTVGPFRLATGADRTVPLSVSSAPVALPTITVEGEGGTCRLDAEEGETVWRLWDEARKVLQVSEIVEGKTVFKTEVMERFVDPFDKAIGSEHTEFITAVGSSPFGVSSAEDLHDRGFVRDSSGGRKAYYGPDARVLLSEVFQETHCFRPIKGRDGLVGLAFEPVEARASSDIQGTLWLDASSSELRHIDFEYTGIPATDRLGIGPEASGLIAYDRLENGGWIVRMWRLRIPIDRVEYGGRYYKLYRERSGRVTGTSDYKSKVNKPRRAPSVYEHGARRDTASP